MLEEMIGSLGLIIISICMGYAWNHALLSLLPRGNGPYVIRAGELVVASADGYVRRAQIGDKHVIGVAAEGGSVILGGFIATGEDENECL